jgi:hypothetical protein
MSLKTAVSNSRLIRDDLRICHCTMSHSRSLAALQGVRHNRADREAFDRASTQRVDRLLGDGDDHAAEIVVDRRRPAGRCHVEPYGTRQRVGVCQSPWVAAPRLMHGIDAERCAVGEQGCPAVAIERRQRVPQILLALGQLLAHC